MHRPSWTYDNPETAEMYPFRQLFHNRKRLWEWRIQGKFKRRPGALYVGIELEDYVPVNFATRSMMRGILPLIQAALQCKMVHHEVGDPTEPELRPTVVAPIWAADSTMVHENPAEAPDIGAAYLPSGLNRKAARQYWENLWAGNADPVWDSADSDGPTYTFALWGPSQLLDLRAWSFRKLPLMWGRSLAMEPFCGKQPVHAVIYELADGETAKRHYQSEKTYVCDIRLMTPAVWSDYAMGQEAGSPVRELSIEDDALSFCSALSGDSPPPDQEERLLNVDGPSFGGSSGSAPSKGPNRKPSSSSVGSPRGGPRSLLCRILTCRCRRSAREFDQLD